MIAPELLRRYDRPGPRYTSYPTAVEFHGKVDRDAYAAALDRAASGSSPVGLYIHLPFCEARCLFCGCNVVITKQRPVARRYLDILQSELRTVGRKLNGARPVTQYHWGGGTPTYYTPDELRELHATVREAFPFAPGAELAVEVDPRVTTAEHLAALREMGFNRLSVGVQDFEPSVQEQVGRIQPFETTQQLLDDARGLGLDSINLDLIYGLPLQTAESFGRTIDEVLELRPERLAIYSYAHVPWMKGHQRKLDESLLPGAELKLDLYLTALARLSSAGYVPIGMDHFALPDDELALAAENGTLWRNFMGYTVRRAGDLVGCGMSGIGEVDGAFFQNYAKLVAYERAVEDGGLATERGYVLTDEDRLRREVIASLMCRFRVDFDGIRRQFDVDFADRFAGELDDLRSLEKDGLVRVSPGAVEVPEKGRLLIRNICMVFDEHLAARRGNRPLFSRTV